MNAWGLEINVWGLEICITAGAADDLWERAQAIVAELGKSYPGLGDQVGACWRLEIHTEASVEDAIADVERALAEIDPEAPKLLSVGQLSG